MDKINFITVILTVFIFSMTAKADEFSDLAKSMDTVTTYDGWCEILEKMVDVALLYVSQPNSSAQICRFSNLHPQGKEITKPFWDALDKYLKSIENPSYLELWKINTGLYVAFATDASKEINKMVKWNIRHPDKVVNFGNWKARAPYWPYWWACLIAGIITLIICIGMIIDFFYGGRMKVMI